MPYSVWQDGEKIGETRLELNIGPRKRGGVFHPTAFGLSVLPGITAMMPALFEFGEMCKAQGIDVEDDRPEVAEDAFDRFAHTPEGKRVQAAAHCIAGLELRDSAGRTVFWESLMISDSLELAQFVARRKSAADQLKALPGDPIRFMISTTFAAEASAARPAGVLGAGEAIPVC